MYTSTNLIFKQQSAVKRRSTVLREPAVLRIRNVFLFYKKVGGNATDRFGLGLVSVGHVVPGLTVELGARTSESSIITV